MTPSTKTHKLSSPQHTAPEDIKVDAGSTSEQQYHQQDQRATHNHAHDHDREDEDEDIHTHMQEHEHEQEASTTPAKKTAGIDFEDLTSTSTSVSTFSPLASKQYRTPAGAARGGGGYNALKSFNGQVYTGMAVGGSHTWNYDQGVWKETKVEPDLWKIDFETTKRRDKNAPRGSGAPEGMEYHWLIVAHQYVKKVDANTYETQLVGSKYKLAHKAASSTSWSVPTVKAQRERELELLDDAKRRVQGLPPVVAGEKVKVEQKEKGQQKLDALFAKTPPRKTAASPGVKRKREEQSDEKENDGHMAKLSRKNNG